MNNATSFKILHTLYVTLAAGEISSKNIVQLLAHTIHQHVHTQQFQMNTFIVYQWSQWSQSKPLQDVKAFLKLNPQRHGIIITMSGSALKFARNIIICDRLGTDIPVIYKLGQ